MQLALTAIQESGTKANGDFNYSIHQAAKDFNVPRSSIARRLKGMLFCCCVFLFLSFCEGGKMCQEAHTHEQLLTAAQEEVLVKWIKVQGHHGIPLTYATIALYVGEICGQEVGGSWPKRFLKHHPDLKIKKTQGLETARAKALNQFAVGGFFDMLDELIKEYDIAPENLYNMDKKGIQLSIGAKVAVMVDRDQKTAYSIEDGNRELVTVIEAICADGSAVQPAVIFQAKRRNAEWGRDNPSNARYVIDFDLQNNPSLCCLCSISISPNGWTDQELGSRWLENDFDPATREKAAGRYRLLILDGHNSHCTFKFCKYAADNNIIVLCLPPHTTHALQLPL
jgi:hypothetical protein